MHGYDDVTPEKLATLVAAAERNPDVGFVTVKVFTTYGVTYTLVATDPLLAAELDEIEADLIRPEPGRVSIPARLTPPQRTGVHLYRQYITGVERTERP